MKAAYQEYKKCQAELKSLDMDEEQKNREMAFLEFEINEIEKASLVPGEDEELEKQYRKLSWNFNPRNRKSRLPQPSISVYSYLIFFFFNASCTICNRIFVTFL